MENLPFGEWRIVPLPLLGLATGVYGHKKSWAEREPSPGCHCRGAGPALLLQDIGTLLCSFGNTSGRADCPVQEGLCPTAGGSSAAELFPLPAPKLSPAPGFTASWGAASGSFSPLALLAGNLPLSLLAWCPLSVPAALPPEHSRASFHLGKLWMASAFGLLAAHLPADFFPMFFNPLLSLEAEIPSSVCQWWLWESFTGMGSPGDVLLRVRLGV